MSSKYSHVFSLHFHMLVCMLEYWHAHVFYVPYVSTWIAAFIGMYVLVFINN